MLQHADYVVCADGAYNWVKQYCIPDIVIGDFDSIDDMPSNIPTERYPVDKDYTDGQLGMQYLLELDPCKITILGARGKRADLEFYNYFLLSYSKPMVQIVLDAGDFWVELVSNNIRRTSNIGKIVSLSPFMGDVHISYTKGLQYCMTNVVYSAQGVAPVSNVVVDTQFEISVYSGQALVFYQK
jgi:thiamine pyrophosphokinase